MLPTPPFSSRFMKVMPRLVLKGKLQLQEKKILKKEPALETKKAQPEKEQLQEIPSDSPEHHPPSPFSSRRVEEPTCSTFGDVSLLSSKIGNGDFDMSEAQESKLAEELLSISTTPLHEPTTITSNPSSSNEHQHQVISCPRLI